MGHRTDFMQTRHIDYTIHIKAIIRNFNLKGFAPQKFKYVNRFN